MFWILRRTGAANFFNSLNNNCTSKSNINNIHTNDKNVKRPERKAYGRLSMESDDTISIKKIDNRFESTELDNNFELKKSKTYPNSDSDGNFLENVTDLDLNGTSLNSVGGQQQQQQHEQQKELNANTISRLQAIAMSDDEDYDESLTCNVCDRAFHCHRQLASHQQKKRHFGCGGCDSLFSSLMLLEHHKEEFEHWSDDEENRRPCCRRNRGEDFTDTDSFDSDAESEDLERLL